MVDTKAGRSLWQRLIGRNMISPRINADDTNLKTPKL